MSVLREEAIPSWLSLRLRQSLIASLLLRMAQDKIRNDNSVNEKISLFKAQQKAQQPSAGGGAWVYFGVLDVLHSLRTILAYKNSA